MFMLDLTPMNVSVQIRVFFMFYPYDINAAPNFLSLLIKDTVIVIIFKIHDLTTSVQ